METRILTERLMEMGKCHYCEKDGDFSLIPPPPQKKLSILFTEFRYEELDIGLLKV